MNSIDAQNTSSPTLRIYVDFDGTMTKEDIGADLFRHLCGASHFDAVTGRWEKGEIDGITMYTELADKASSLSHADLHAFLAAYTLDPAFHDFLSWCEQCGYPLVILSDGFDLYINPLLEREGLSLPLRCNGMTLTDDGRMRLHFPWAHERCLQSANCKAHHVALLSRDEDRIVYIGDGRSDFEAATLADMVFAKKALETWCQQENITFRRFTDFNDIHNALSTLIRQGRLRRRKRAEILRRQLWMSG
jgi:2-hydroxy-3-keto-5-methylthiopentenyl-1-phosphate phosphatase